ncbi:MAG TPA: isoamylase early set domain-containing protein, partial [Thermodesulfobacteriota bacterium]|nr:isoamylase early set domain-containing protein [Thermodesulfobacteriota bacterium]
PESPSSPSASAPAEAAVAVAFRLRAPEAREVAVVGDFNHWQVGATPLEDRDGDGTWTAVVRIGRGRYHYQFVIDGQRWVADPQAALQVDDGFGGRNAVLEV